MSFHLTGVCHVVMSEGKVSDDTIGFEVEPRCMRQAIVTSRLLSFV